MILYNIIRLKIQSYKRLNVYGAMVFWLLFITIILTQFLIEGTLIDRFLIVSSSTFILLIAYSFYSFYIKRVYRDWLDFIPNMEIYESQKMNDKYYTQVLTEISNLIRLEKDHSKLDVYIQNYLTEDKLLEMLNSLRDKKIIEMFETKID